MESSSTHFSGHFLGSFQESPTTIKSSVTTLDWRFLSAIGIGLILIALLFAFFRCIIRSIRRRSCNTNDTNSTTSLNQELAAFPVIIYGATSTSEAEDCAICLEEYKNGDAIRVLPRCKHMFHKECLEKWVQVPSLHCPICRDRMLEGLIQRPATSCRISGNYSIAAFPSRNII